MAKIKQNKTRITMLGLLAIVLSIMGWRMGGQKIRFPFSSLWLYRRNGQQLP